MAMTSPNKASGYTTSKERDVLGKDIEIYANANDPYCHRLRFALKLKNVNPKFIEVEDLRKPPTTLRDLNPRCKEYAVPTLVERDLVIYHPDIVLRYIDGRFPNPPLLPQFPGEQAKYDLQVWEVKENIIKCCDAILAGKNRYKASKLEGELLHKCMLFSYQDEARFTLSKDSEERHPDMIDCMLAPVLWRFSVLGINMPSKDPKYRKLKGYMRWLFAQKAFIACCSDAELEMSIH